MLYIKEKQLQSNLEKEEEERVFNLVCFFPFFICVLK